MTVRLACETARHKQREPPGYPVYCKREDDSMANVYQVKGGSLRVTIVQPDNLKNVQLSFWVFDQKSKIVTYCWYGSDMSDRAVEEQFAGTIKRSQVGVGGHPGLANLTKPLDLARLDATKWTLTLATKAEYSSGAPGTATLLRDKDAVMLEFPIVAGFDRLPLKTHGMIFLTETAKTGIPKFPKDYTGDPKSD